MEDEFSQKDNVDTTIVDTHLSPEQVSDKSGMGPNFVAGNSDQFSLSDVPKQEIEEKIENYQYDIDEISDNSEVDTNIIAEDINTLKEKNRHEEWQNWLSKGNLLVMIALALLIIVWIVSLFINKEDREFTQTIGIFEILKTVLFTTIGYIFGARSNGNSDD